MTGCLRALATGMRIFYNDTDPSSADGKGLLLSGHELLKG